MMPVTLVNFCSARRVGWLVATIGLLLGLLVVLPGCPPTPVAPPATIPARQELKVSLTTARRQKSYVSLAGLGLPGGAVMVEIGNATGPGEFVARNVGVWGIRRRNTTVSSPAAEQFLGEPSTRVDAGSSLFPAVTTDQEKSRTFECADLTDMLLRVEVPAALPVGTYTFPVRIGPTTKAPAPFVPTRQLALEVVVSDLALPGTPAILALATTSTADLAGTYPASWGQIQGMYLDRAEDEHKAAVDQLDILVRTAHDHGLALFVEDLAPSVKLDTVGRITLDWDAYDRTMLPYLEGSAFASNGENPGGLPVWFAPLPPRRIRDIPNQLRQYWQACLAHAREKGWAATPVIMHPALLEEGNPDLRRVLLEMLREEEFKAAAIVAAPDVAVGQRGCFWAIHDADRRLPPVGALATETSVRVWPWMCHARGLKGFLWRHAIGREAETGSADFPLLVERPATGEAAAPMASLRLAWLTAGLNDAEHFGLLRKRTDPVVAAEVLAGIVGRTGLTSTPVGSAEIPFLSPVPGYLYAGWPTTSATWQTLPAMLDRLIQASNPGEKVQLPPDDPLYLATRMFLAQAHRPVARSSGYRFFVDPTREGPILTLESHLLIENPLGTATDIGLGSSTLPGDLQLAPAPATTLPANGLVDHPVRLAGHLDSLLEPGKALALQITERSGGAMLELPVALPIYRMRPTRQPLKVDGRGRDWPEEVRPAAYGPMPVATRFATRPDLLAGSVRSVPDPSAATVWWTYDSDFLYALIRCPQPKIGDQRTSEWPALDDRWWASDGVQIQLAGGPRLDPGTKIMHLGIKASGVVLARSAVVFPGQPLRWSEPAVGSPGLRYGITTDAAGYTLELAIPRKWFPVDHDKDPNVPIWRVNVLRHQEHNLRGASWSGPLIDDSDAGMMGALIGG